MCVKCFKALARRCRNGAAGLLALAALCLLQPAQAATYAADASAFNATLYPWIDISSSGTGLTLQDDDVSATLNIGFSFRFGSTTYTTLRVMSNGQVQFGSTDTSYSNTTLPLDGSNGKPNINAVMLPLWDDLVPDPNEVRYLSSGTAPNRVFTIAWLNVSFYKDGSKAAGATFQVQIHEQGQFVYRYGTVDGSGGAHSNTDGSNPAGATIGYELSDTDHVQFSRNSATVPSGTTIVWSQISSPTLELLFSERQWSGVANEVQDSAGNAYHGTAASLSATKPSTANTTPAVGTSVGTCGYGVFNRNNKDHVALPSTLPNLGSTPFTVTGWIRSTNNTLVGQRIFVDDENGSGSATVGYGLTLGDGGTGKLRFYTRALASSKNLDTAAVINNNTWYFVAFGINPATKTKVVYVYNTAGAQLAAVAAAYTESSIGSDGGITTIGGESNSANGSENTNSYGFAGNLDELRVYPSALTATELATVRSASSPCAANLVAEYRFEESGYTGTAGELTDTAGYTGGPFNGKAQGSPLPTMDYSAPARSGTAGTCGYTSLPGPGSNGGNFIVSGLPVVTTAAAQTSVAFWMYWDGSNSRIPLSFDTYDLWLNSGHFGFNTKNSDVYGIASTGLANSWHHVVAVFTNGSVTNNQLWIDGVQQTLTQRLGTPTLGNAVVSSSLRFGMYGGGAGFNFSGRLDEAKVYNGAVTSTQIAALYAETHTCPILLDHVELQHSSGNGLTCSPSTLTVKACQNSSCSTAYTGGLTGTLTASGSGMTVIWPAGASFTIASGSSTTTATYNLQQTTVGSTTLGVSGLSITPNGSNTCNFGSPLCTFTAADTGLLFDVPNHRAEASNTVTVTAVKKADNSAACTPAFASVSKAVTFKCSYTNPTSGTLPVRVGSAALNSGNSSSAACDATGQAVSLAFNASGVASATVKYADVGTVALSASYTGSGTGAGGDAGLVMTGSDSFTTAPYFFSVYGITSGNLVAGSSFAVSVAAKNVAGNITPNFGRETAAETTTLGFVRTQPQGSGASNGAFSGSLGSFSGGVASASNLVWSEVGRGEVTALLSSANYLGSGLTAAGASNDSTACAAQGATCTLPTGVTAAVYYGYNGWYNARSGITGSIACNNATFGDPLVGDPNKACSYFVTSGASSASTGSAGPFIPHHFDVTTTPACGAFSYAGQPFAATVTARNANNATTVNYDGSANTTPSFAKATTLSEPTALGVGTLAGTSMAASTYLAGVASSSPSYSFTSKTTSNRTLGLRAIDTDSVSSASYTEGSMPLRSGRLRLSNAFGSASAALQMAVVAEYWSGSNWVLNSADSCSTLGSASVALSNPRSATGAASSASSSAGSLSISNGSGVISLTAPTPSGSSLSLDIALNLGSTSADQSCQANHPTTTGAAKPWLRAQNGACASTADRDPAARASFGIFSPETKRTVHVREVF